MAYPKKLRPNEKLYHVITDYS